MSIKPYLDTKVCWFDCTDETGGNDQIFVMINGQVEHIKSHFSATDKVHIKAYQNTVKIACIKHVIRNIGAGSAVDSIIQVNGFKTELAIAKDECINLYYYLNRLDEKEVPFEIVFDYWDTESRGHYLQKEKTVLNVNGEKMTIAPIERSRVVID